MFPNGDDPHTEAFRWDAEGGMVDLGDLPGHTDSIAARHGSADGSVIVGSGIGPNGIEAWLAVLPEPGSAIPVGIGFLVPSHARRRREARR
jgi:hypothetical protein